MSEGENKPLVIVGAGGFGREVAWLVEDINKVKLTWNLLGFVDDKAQVKTVEGLNILGRVALLYKMEPRPWVVIAIGDGKARKDLAGKIAEKKLALATLIHPTVIMSKNVQIGCGTVICAGSILTTNIKIGKSCIFGLGCRIGQDTVLGDYASLMQGVNLAGEVTVREGVYSFNGNKIITTSGGGMLVSDDLGALKKMRFWATQSRDAARHYQHSEVGYNYRLSNILAAVGRGQLEVLEERVRAWRAVFERYYSAFSDVAGFDFMPEVSSGRSNRWLTVLTVDEKRCGVTATAIIDALEVQNIEARPVWKPLHLQPLFKDCAYYPHKVLTEGISDRLFEKGLCLPSGSNLSEEEQQRVINCIKECLG